MHTFTVSEVTISTTAEPRPPLDSLLRERLGGPFEAYGSAHDDLVENVMHPFVGAAHLAFAEHHPLTLSPDDVWLCIAQGFAAHVDANAESLRDRFVRQESKEAIVIFRDEFRRGHPGNDWPGCFTELSAHVAERVGKVHDLVVADFSTTGPVEKAASEVVLLASMKSYFDYTVVTRCGIPRVTLLGTVEDWRSIRRRAAVLAEYGLGWWVDELVPLLDELVAAASGRPNVALWRSFYKCYEGSGGPYVSGWINALFPFLTRPSDDGESVRNPHVATWQRDLGRTFHSGPTTAEFPSGLALAPFTWEYLGTKLPMELVAGFFGVSQDARTGAVRPAIGWAVRDAPKRV